MATTDSLLSQRGEVIVAGMPDVSILTDWAFRVATLELMTLSQSMSSVELWQRSFPDDVPSTPTTSNVFGLYM